MNLPFNKRNSAYYYNLMEVGLRRTDKKHLENLYDNLERSIANYAGIFGSTFYSLNDCSTGNYLYVSSECERVTGYKTNYFMRYGLEGYIDMRVPEHDKPMKSMVTKCWEFIHLLPQEKRLYTMANFDYVMVRGDNGKLVRLLDQEVVASLDEDGKLWVSLGLCHDISHLKPNDPGIMPATSIYVNKTRKHFIYNPASRVFINLETLTNREKEILIAYGKDKSSHQISEELFISKFTVQSHRANLYKKTGCTSLAELRFLAKSLYV